MTTMRAACVIQECGLPTVAHGWCENHYRRWLRNGDPLAGRVSNGEPERFLHDTVFTYDGDECLSWPFAKSHGRPRIRREFVTRLVCEEANGPPPTPYHEAAHSCGKGHLACVTKRHLSWKTHAENMADMIHHGTSTQGERHPNAKLTEDDVSEIRRLAAHSTQREIAKLYGIAQSHVANIHSGAKWRPRHSGE